MFRAQLIPLLVLLVAGCAHTGSVVSRTGPQEAEVCFPDDGLSVGEPVALYDRQCHGSTFGGKGRTRVCRDIHVGDGTVTQVLDDRCSRVRVEPGTAFDTRTRVRRTGGSGTTADD